MEVNSKSGSCTNLCNYKGKGVERMKASNGSSCYSLSCRKLDGAAAWLCHSLAAAFFASLEWCSCIYVDTIDGPSDPRADNSIGLPLLSNSDPQDLDDIIITTTEINNQVEL